MRTLRSSDEQQSVFEARVRDDERTHMHSALRLGLHYDSHLYHQLTYVFTAREQVSPVLWSRDAVAETLPADTTALDILNEAHRVWFGIERGTHKASDLDAVLDPRRWVAK